MCREKIHRNVYTTVDHAPARDRGGYPLGTTPYSTLEFIIFLSDRIRLQELDLSFSTVFFFLQTDTVVRRTDARKICLVRKS